MHRNFLVLGMIVGHRYQRVIIFILAVTLFKIAGGQSYLLSSLPVEKDLSSRQITSIFQDSRGFMWIGTDNGLNFYDANSIKVFKHDVKDKTSLLENTIDNICEDRLGHIWVATANGVDCYDPSTGIFEHYTKDDQQLGFGFTPKVYSDQTGNIWVAMEGLFRFDFSRKQFSKVVTPHTNNSKDKRRGNRINGFFQDSKLRYWASTYDGLYLFDDAGKTFTRVDVPPNDDNYRRFGILYGSVYESKSGELYVGTWGYGIFKIVMPVTGTGGIHLQLVSDKEVGLTYATQGLDSREIFWFSVHGLQAIDAQNILQVELSHQPDDPYSLRTDPISVLFTDKQNQLWIGYEKEGIQILSPGNQLFKTYKIKSDNHSISSIGVIAEKSNSYYVGGWYKNALCKLDKNYNIEKWWDYLPPGKSNTSSNVGDIYFDRQHNVWIATANGLVFLDETAGTIKNFTIDSSISKRSFFLKILPEGDSVLWLPGYDNGLSRFSLTTHKFQLYGGNPLPFLWKCVFDCKGNIWCANNNGLVQKFDRQTAKFTTYNFDSLTERSIYFDMAYDSTANKLWVASTNGLLRIDLATLSAKLYTEKDGLATSKISLLTWDAQHRLWIGTDRGLSVCDVIHDSFRNFYLNNGLFTEKLDHTLSVGSNGKLYIGADNAFMTMDIQSLNENPAMSPVYITGIIENGKLQRAVIEDSLPTIKFPYTKNSLSLEFAIADFINPEDNQLSYRLEGWDKDFIQTKNGEATYNKLPPGKYTFRVKGINHNGIRNDKGDVIVIIIEPPFWKTWWFIALVSLVLVTALVAAIRYISQRNLKEKLLLLEKEQAVEKERNRISRDMHDDLGSGLTKIAIMSEVVKKQIHEPEKAKQQLENISESSRELVDSLQDIIWILNPKNDTLESLGAYIREYALKFFEPFGTELQFSYPETLDDVKLSEETRRNIFLAIKESFNNICKHAWCNKVKVEITSPSRKVVILVKDDGRGFDIMNVRPFSNGLTNMQNRIGQVGGHYEIKSTPGRGTTTTITIPV